MGQKRKRIMHARASGRSRAVRAALMMESARRARRIAVAAVRKGMGRYPGRNQPTTLAGWPYQR